MKRLSATSLTNYNKVFEKKTLIIYCLILISTSSIAQNNSTSFNTNSRDTIIVNYSKEVPKIDDKAIFLYPEIPPSFPGGSQALQNYIQNYLEYNTEQFHQGIEGKIQAGFVVNENGNISHIRILKGLNPELDKSVVDLIYKMPKWIPGQISKTKIGRAHV